jgi:hypothetical protein
VQYGSDGNQCVAKNNALLHLADMACLWIFIAELTLKFIVMRLAMFRDPWNIVDLAVATIAPTPEALAAKLSDIESELKGLRKARQNSAKR